MWTLEDFIRESNRIEGILREPTADELDAHFNFLSLTRITISDLEIFVETIRSGAILRRSVGLDVRVGNHIAPPGGPEIEDALKEILNNIYRLGVYSTHLSYEILHPFTDGNGRSGRVLWLRTMGGILNAPLGFLHHFYYQTLDSRS